MEHHHPVLGRLTRFIEDSGHRTEIIPAADDDDGIKFFVRFKSRGERFQVNFDTFDPTFLFLSAAYQISERPRSDGDLRRTLLETQQAVKAVKFSTEGDLLVAAVEQFWDESAGFEQIFWRCVGVLSHGAGECMQRLAIQSQAKAKASPGPQPVDARAAAQRFIAELAPGQSARPPAAPAESARKPRTRRKKPQQSNDSK